MFRHLDYPCFRCFLKAAGFVVYVGAFASAAVEPVCFPDVAVVPVFADEEFQFFVVALALAVPVLAVAPEFQFVVPGALYVEGGRYDLRNFHVLHGLCALLVVRGQFEVEAWFVVAQAFVPVFLCLVSRFLAFEAELHRYFHGCPLLKVWNCYSSQVLFLRFQA